MHPYKCNIVNFQREKDSCEFEVDAWKAKYDQEKEIYEEKLTRFKSDAVSSKNARQTPDIDPLPYQLINPTATGEMAPRRSALSEDCYDYTGVRELFVISIAKFDRTDLRDRNSAADDAAKIRDAFGTVKFSFPDENRLVGHVTISQAKDRIQSLVRPERQAGKESFENVSS